MDNYKNKSLSVSNPSTTGQTYTDATLVGDVTIAPGAGKFAVVQLGSAGGFDLLSADNQHLIQCDDSAITVLDHVYEAGAIVAPRIASGMPSITSDGITLTGFYGTGEAGHVIGYSLTGGVCTLCTFALPDPPVTQSDFLSGTTILVGCGENLTSVAAIIDPFAHTASIVGNITNPGDITSFHFVIHSY